MPQLAQFFYSIVFLISVFIRNFVNKIVYLLELLPFSFLQRVNPIKPDVPKNIAFIIADRSYLNTDFLHNIFHFSAQHGIAFISIYDPWSFFYNRRADISNVSAIQDTASISITPKMILRGGCGIEAIVTVSKKLSRKPEVVQIVDVSNELEKELLITEPDFVVKIGDGCSNTAGFPSWFLRVAEIYELSRTLVSNKLFADEFSFMMHQYSKRKRRFGR